MIIFYSGFGLLTPFFGFIGLFLATLVTKNMQPDGDQFQITIVIGGFAAAIFSWCFGAWVNSPRKDRIVIDKRTGREVRLKRRSTLFWVPIQYYSLAYIAIALWGLSLK